MVEKHTFFQNVKVFFERSIGLNKGIFSAIDLSTASIKLVTGLTGSSGITLLHAITGSLSSHTQEEWCVHITEYLKQWKRDGVLASRVYVSFSSLDIIVHRVDIPKMPLNEVREALRWVMKDQISIPIEDALYDYRLIGEKTEEEGDIKFEVMYAVLAKDKVLEIHSLFKKMDIVVLGLTSSVFSLASLLSFGNYFASSSLVTVLDIGAELTHISFYREGKLIFGRNIPLGSHHLTEAIMELGATLQAPNTLTYEDAELLKKKYGIPLEESTMCKEKVEPRQLYLMMRPILELLANEVMRSREYLESHFGIKTEEKGKVYLIGNGANLKYIDAFLKEKINQEIGTLELPPLINTARMKGFDQGMVKGYIPAIAGLVSQDKTINLIPEYLQVKKVYTYEKIVARMVLFGIAIALITSFFLIFIQLNFYRKNMARLKQSAKEIAEFVQKKQEVGSFETIIKYIYHKKIPTWLFLAELSNKIFYDLEVKKIILDQEEMTITIGGYLLAEGKSAGDALSRFINTLSESILLQGIDVNYVKLVQYKMGNTEEFEIKCTLREDNNEALWSNE